MNCRVQQEMAPLRERMVAALVKDGVVASTTVQAVMRAVPRHVFLPEAAVNAAHAPFDAVVTKRDARGDAVSSVSAPQVHAFMLEQADLRPGMRVLEIGSGGYGAALIAELVGAGGEVTTLDIDPEITERARTLLDRAGYGRVRVVLGDGEDGAAEHAPYDRVLVTAGAWDIPPGWTDQLAPDGRLLVPLRMRGLTRVLALEPAATTSAGAGVANLVSRSSKLFGFVPVQGRGAHPFSSIRLRGGELILRFDDRHSVDPDGIEDIEAALRGPRTVAWTGVRVGRTESADTLQMWLATVAPNFCAVLVDPALDTGLITVSGRRSFVFGAVAGGSLACLTTRPTDSDTEVEFGVHAFGEQAPGLAELVTDALMRWDSAHRGGPGPRIRVFPAGTPDALLGATHVIEKRHRRITLTWARTAANGGTRPAPPSAATSR